jgi:hypothetical protein
LTPLEFSVMERHSFETYQILRHIPGLEQVAEWAAFHHEALNGHGYPFRRRRPPLAARRASSLWRMFFRPWHRSVPTAGAQRAEQIPRFLDDFRQTGSTGSRYRRAGLRGSGRELARGDTRGVAGKRLKW